MTELTAAPRTAPTSPPPVRSPLRPIVAGVLAGLALAVAWSYEFVDKTIGDNTANSLLGHDAKQTAIGGAAVAVVFAFVSGLAGTFTACNIAVFGALPQITEGARAGSATPGARLRAMLHALGWISAGMLAVSAAYGVIAVLLGDRLPQLSTRTLAGGLPERLVQASVVFGLIGLAFGCLGLAALGVLPDPFARRPRTRLLVLGALIGGFLVGRPYPLFGKLLEYAVATDNPLYGALYFCLQSVGNIAVVAVIATIVALVARPGTARAQARLNRLSGAALLALGVFLIVYWDVRVPAIFGFGWFPTMPWN